MQAQPTPFPLSQQEILLLSESYADIISLLRANVVATQWIFHWVLDRNPSLADARHLDLSRSRGFRTMHMCAAPACASVDDHTVLQKATTLLLPVHTKQSLVLGYFLESAADPSTTDAPTSGSGAPRLGKYVYCASARELIKVSKVRGPSSAGHLASVCINKTAIVAPRGQTGMFVSDYVMASFPWQDRGESTHLPELALVHSRTLAFHRLVQTAQQAGFAGHFDSDSTSGMQGVLTETGGGTSDGLGVTESSFAAIGEFGVYECALVPSKLGPGMQLDTSAVNHNSPTSPSQSQPALSVGKWAVPEHSTFCRGYQVLHLGMFRNEAAELRSQFVQAYGHVSADVGRQVGAGGGTTNFDDNTQAFVDGTQSRPGNGVTTTGDDVEPKVSDALGYMTQTAQAQGAGHTTTAQAQRQTGHEPPGGQVATVEFRGGGGDGTETHFEGAGSVTIRSTSSAGRFEPGTGAQGGSGGAVATVRAEDGGVVLPLGQGLVGGAQVFHGGVEDVLHEMPSTMVDSIEAVVVSSGMEVEKRGSGDGKHGKEIVGGGTGPTLRPAPPSGAGNGTGGISGTGTGTGSGTGSGSGLGGRTEGNGGGGTGTNGNSSGEVGGTGMKAFKKTLPAPTKSEIVIRNRISAQRSNEKRRRKIEATKSELAYLKATYLPHLEHRRGTLLSENQTLRLKFMEKYHESDIVSFFE